jgi:glycosyltransferase involved in cell wall biosynthesis
MSIFNIPAWLKPHFYSGKNFKDLTAEEILELRQRLSRFKATEPEVSVVIPAWNEADSIFKTLSSLAATRTKKQVELIVINNNSTDATQTLLDALDVKSYFQPNQGISYTRQMGLMKAKGKYHLCADSDTFYPPNWIDLMIDPLINKEGYVGVYGRYSFIPAPGENRLPLSIYEAITGVLIRLRRYKREHLNVLGFNMGFITGLGIKNGGFEVTEARMFDNAKGSTGFVEEAEDGRMALNLKLSGKLYLVKQRGARVYTSSRRLTAEGGLFEAFKSRVLLHSNKIGEYIKGAEVR